MIERFPTSVPEVPGAMSERNARDLVLRWYDVAQNLRLDPVEHRIFLALDVMEAVAHSYLIGRKPSERDIREDPQLFAVAQLVAHWARGYIAEEERRQSPKTS